MKINFINQHVDGRQMVYTGNCDKGCFNLYHNDHGIYVELVDVLGKKLKDQDDDMRDAIIEEFKNNSQ